MEIICSVIICSLVLKEIAAVATYCLAFQNLYVIITSEAANCSVIWNSVVGVPFEIKCGVHRDVVLEASRGGLEAVF